MSRYINIDPILEWCGRPEVFEPYGVNSAELQRKIRQAPSIDIVHCGECKHRPIKDDPDGADYGFNIVEPTDGDDVCPCLVEDGWYSWMPEDNFYCGRGERRNNDR